MIQDYRLVYYGASGTSRRQLTAEQIELIRRALEDNLGPRAIVTARGRYLVAVPGADYLEALQYVERLATELRQQHPEKYKPRPLNWIGIVICSILEIPILSLFGGVFLVPNPTAYLTQIGYAFLLTVALLYFRRVKGFRKRTLLFVPGLVLMVFSVAILPWLTDVGPASILPYLTGVLFALSLKAFSLSWYRKQTVSKP